MNLYAGALIGDLEGANNKSMRNYKRLLERSKEARLALFKFCMERKVPIIAKDDGYTNSALPPIKEERSDEVLQEVLSLKSASGGESESTYGENIQVLTVTPCSEGDISEAYDTEYVSSEQEDSYVEDYEVHYVPLRRANIPHHKTERFSSARTSPKLEAKQGYTDLRNDLYGPDYYYYETPEYVQPEVVDENLYESQTYVPTQQFYDDDYDIPLQQDDDNYIPIQQEDYYDIPLQQEDDYDIPVQQEDDEHYFYDNVHNLRYAPYPKHYRYVYEQPNIYIPQECYYRTRLRHNHLHQDYGTPREYVVRNQSHGLRRPKRYHRPPSRQYYEQAPYSRHASHHSSAYYIPECTTYYEEPQYYYDHTPSPPYYVTHPRETYFECADYPQFEENGHYSDSYENYDYETYPEDVYYY